MQTIKTYIKTYIKKVKLLNPITLFKNNLILFEKLEHRVRNLERVNDFGDIERRLEDLEYYDLYNIEEKAENAERKAEENDNYIESIKERSETNQESIKILKDKFNVLKHNIESDKENLFDIEADIKTIKKVDFAGIAERFNEIDDDINYCKEYVIENRLDNVSCETFNKLLDRVKRLENSPDIKHINDDVNRLDKRLETLENETSTKKIREIVAEVLCDKGLQLNLLDDRVDNLEELAKKYLNAELEAVALKQERSEQSLSDIQRLAFEICHYYGGEFDVNDFDNCFEIISKYDVVWKRNPQPKKTKF